MDRNRQVKEKSPINVGKNAYDDHDDHDICRLD